MHKRQLLKLKSLASIFATLGIGSLAYAQDEDSWKKATVCEPQAVSIAVVSLKRVAPGNLRLTIAVASSANVPLKFGAPINLVDDAGDSWMARTDDLSPNNFFPGVKTTASIHFRRDIGGNAGTTATLSSNQLVGVRGQAKNFGRCMWIVSGIPIQ